MYMNPTTHTQSMTTWRVVGTENILANSLRILNLKFNFDEEVVFKSNVGVWGCVNRIRFLDLNGVEVDNFENIGQIMSLMLAMSDNETSRDITQVLYGNNFYQLVQNNPLTPIATIQHGTTEVNNLRNCGEIKVDDVVELRGTLNGQQVVLYRKITAIADETHFTIDSQIDAVNDFTLGLMLVYSPLITEGSEVVDSTLRHLRLIRCLDFLRKSITLNKGFILQIEWNTNFTQWINPVGNAPNNYNLDPPVLAFEVYSKPLPNPQTISYYTFKTNKVQVPAIAQVGALQKIDVDLKGFKGLFLRRILLVNCNQTPQATDTNRDDDDFGNFCSLVQADENINFSLDGKSLMTYKGLFSSAQKSGVLNDIWGSVLGYQGCDKLVDYKNIYGEVGIGNRAYGCVEISSLINKEFVLNYQRVGVDADRQKALTVHCIAEVLKTYDENKGLITYMLM